MTAALEYLSAIERQAYDAVVAGASTPTGTTPVEDAIADALAELARRRERDAGQPPTAQESPTAARLAAQALVKLDLVLNEPGPIDTFGAANLAQVVENLSRIIPTAPRSPVVPLTADLGKRLAEHVYATLDGAGRQLETAALARTAVLDAVDELLITGGQA